MAKPPENPGEYSIDLFIVQYDGGETKKLRYVADWGPYQAITTADLKGAFVFSSKAFANRLAKYLFYQNSERESVSVVSVKMRDLDLYEDIYTRDIVFDD